MKRDTLAELRSKPKAIKDHYALLGAVVVTVIIAGIWGLLQVMSLQSRGTVVEQPEQRDAPAFSTFLQEARKQFASVFDSVNTTIATSSEVANEPAIGPNEVVAQTATTTPQMRIATRTPAATLPPARVVRIATTSASTTSP